MKMETTSYLIGAPRKKMLIDNNIAKKDEILNVGGYFYKKIKKEDIVFRELTEEEDVYVAEKYHFIWEGWRKLIFPLIKAVEEFNKNVRDPQYIHQIGFKEKYGGLVVLYIDGYEIWDEFIEKVEEECSITCHSCGKYGVLRDDLRWYMTLCDDCYECVLKQHALEGEKYEREMMEIKNELGQLLKQLPDIALRVWKVHTASELAKLITDVCQADGQKTSRPEVVMEISEVGKMLNSMSNEFTEDEYKNIMEEALDLSFKGCIGNDMSGKDAIKNLKNGIMETEEYLNLWKSRLLTTKRP